MPRLVSAGQAGFAGVADDFAEEGDAFGYIGRFIVGELVAPRVGHVAPAMAAKHLNVLEARLSVTLVNRTTRRLSLTEAGTVYLIRAGQILAVLREAEAEVSARPLAVEGLLRVSAPAAFGVLHLGELIAEFHRLHPAVTVELRLDDRYVDVLEERWDMAIRIGKLADSGLVARKLADVRLTSAPHQLFCRARAAA